MKMSGVVQRIFWDDRYGEFEHFKDTMTTPNGDTVVAFGYYGYDA